MIHPVVVGSGKRRFDDVGTATPQLAETSTTGPGVAVLTNTRAEG